jgi:5'(3')-deoxyribonucleotidase
MYKIAVDLDEVLFPMLKSLSSFGTRTNRVRTIPPKGKFEYNYAKIFSISPRESKLLVRDFYESSEAYEALPIENSIQGINKLREYGDLYVVSGRQSYNVACEHTENFLNKYYPDCFKDYIHTNSYSLIGQEKTKGEICNDTKMDFLIDDIYNNCENCGNAKGILFGNYQWTPDHYDTMYWRCWDEIKLK